MAIYHLHAKAISRGKGQSAVATAAYRAAEKLHDERTGETKDYTKKQGVEFSGIFAPKNAPEWSQNREQLWNAVEASEKRKDARLAREIEIALPHELTDEQRRYLVQDFVKDNITRKGLVADVAIHAPDRNGDERNHHAHILFTTRAINAEGFEKNKLRELDDKATLQHWRESWEKHANRHLERWGCEERVSCKSLEDQGIDREPTKKLGETATHLERLGINTERGNENRDIESRNTERETLKREAAVIDIALEREKRREQMRPPDTPVQPPSQERKNEPLVLDIPKKPEPAKEIEPNYDDGLARVGAFTDRAVDTLDRAITDTMVAVGEVFERAAEDLLCPDTPEQRQQKSVMARMKEAGLIQERTEQEKREARERAEQLLQERRQRTQELDERERWRDRSRDGRER